MLFRVPARMETGLNVTLSKSIALGNLTLNGIFNLTLPISAQNENDSIVQDSNINEDYQIVYSFVNATTPLTNESHFLSYDSGNYKHNVTDISLHSQVTLVTVVIVLSVIIFTLLLVVFVLLLLYCKKYLNCKLRHAAANNIHVKFRPSNARVENAGNSLLPNGNRFDEKFVGDSLVTLDASVDLSLLNFVSNRAKDTAKCSKLGYDNHTLVNDIKIERKTNPNTLEPSPAYSLPPSYPFI